MILELLLSAFISQASAQNPQCPTRPFGDSSNACASTAFVQNALSGTGFVVGPASATDGDVALFDGTTGKLIRDSGSSLRTRLTTNKTYTVTPTGTDALTCGTVGSPCRTVQYTASLACNQIDLAGSLVTIDMTAFSGVGNSENIVACNYLNLGTQAQATMVILATGVNQTGSFIAVGIPNFWTLKNGTWLSVEADAGAWVNLDGVTCPAGCQYQFLNGGTVEVINTSITFSGSAACPLNGALGGKFLMQPTTTLAITGTPTWTSGFICMDSVSSATFRSVTLTNPASAIGPKYNISNFSTLLVGAGVGIDPNSATACSGAPCLPGSTNGTPTPWTNPTLTAPVTITANAIGAPGGSVGTTDALILQNATAAANGAQQQSPNIRLTGQGWKTNATAASQQVDWIVTNIPVQGTASPTSFLGVYNQVNNGGYTQLFNFNDTGVFNSGNGYQIGGVAASGVVLRGDGTKFVASTLTLPNSATSGGVAYFSSTTAMASSAIMSTNNVMSGGGAGNPPVVSPCTLGASTSLACSTSSASNPQFVLINTTADAGSPQFLFEKNRSGGNTNSADSILDFQAYGFANTAQQITGRIQFIQAAASSGSNVPSKFVVNTSNAAGQINQSMTLDNAGTLSIPNGVAATSKTTGTVIVTGGIGVSGATYTDTLNIITVANASTTAALCWNSGTGLVTENGAVGTCTVSTLAAKDLVAPLSPEEGFAIVMGMKPWRYDLKKDLPTYRPGEQIGFVAEYALENEPRLVSVSKEGKVEGFLYEQYTAALTAAFKQLNARVEQLEGR